MRKGGRFWDNPLLLKEMRGRMRTPKTPLLMSLFLLVLGGAMFGFMYIQLQSTQTYRPGVARDLFMALSTMQLVLIAFVAPGLTAGAISGERERQTLNILLTTHLSPTKIVLSKLASSLSLIWLLVFATLPVYAAVFLYGGVALWMLFGVFGYYLMCMVLFGAIGLFCSARFKRSGSAVVVSYILTAFVLVGTVVLGFILQELVQLHQLRNGITPHPLPGLYYWFALNPIMNVLSIFDSQILLRASSGWYTEYPIQPWLYFLLVYGTVVVLLLFWSVRLVTPVKKKRFTIRRAKGRQV